MVVGDQILMRPILCIDIETTGKIYHLHKILCLGVKTEKFQLFKWWDQIDKKALKGLLESHRVVGHNIKFDLSFLVYHLGLDMDLLEVDDTYIMAKLLHMDMPSRRDSLSACCARYLGVKHTTKDELRAFKSSKHPWLENKMEQVPADLMEGYAGEDVELSYRLYFRLLRLIQLRGLTKIYEIERNALIPILRIEYNGFQLDLKAMNRMRIRYTRFEIACVNRLRDMAPHVNPNSDLSVAAYLGPDLLEAIGNSDKLDKRALKQLSNPYAALLLRYRRASKIRGTYLQNIPSYCTQDGRLHYTYRQLEAGTGRMSAVEPAVQTIDKKSPLRYGFICPPGYFMLSADFAQQE